jgi:hypothetical protein
MQRCVATTSELRPFSDERNDLEQMFLTTKSAAVTYDPREVLAWLRVEAPVMAASVAPILGRHDRGK